MTPSGEATAAAGLVWLMAEARERRLLANTRSDGMRIVAAIVVTRRRSRRVRSRQWSYCDSTVSAIALRNTLAYIEYIVD